MRLWEALVLLILLACRHVTCFRPTIIQSISNARHTPFKERVTKTNTNAAVTIRCRQLPMSAVNSFAHVLRDDVHKSLDHVGHELQGCKAEGLSLLILNGVLTPILEKLKISSILGFIFSGVILGPNGLNLIRNLHLIEVLGELGIILFLFEVGLELTRSKLSSLARDIIHVGVPQYLLTTLLFTALACSLGHALDVATIIGSSLALSSSAFVFQILRDKNAVHERHANASHGLLLLQDLAVVPLLVLIRLLSNSTGASPFHALSIALIKAVITTVSILGIGTTLVTKLCAFASRSTLVEPLMAWTIAWPILMSYFTHGIGLSDSLGAFAAGMSLSSSNNRHSIEKAVAPVRGLLLSLFFFKVGSSIDFNFVQSNMPKLVSGLAGLLLIKSVITTVLCTMNKMSFQSSIKCGLLNAQSGEFALVAFATSAASGLLSPADARYLTTLVILSMAATPVLADGADFLSRVVGGESRGIKSHSE